MVQKKENRGIDAVQDKGQASKTDNVHICLFGHNGCSVKMTDNEKWKV